MRNVCLRLAGILMAVAMGLAMGLGPVAADDPPDYLAQWGSRGGGPGQFNFPRGIAVDSAGDVYVVDAYNYRLQKFDGDGVYLLEWGVFGMGDGQFYFPLGVAVDNQDRVFVADGTGVQIFDSSGSFLFRFGGHSYKPTNGQFIQAGDAALDGDGYIYVTDTSGSWSWWPYGHRIQAFSPQGSFLAKWGSKGSAPGRYYLPTGIAFDSFGTLLIADTGNSRLQRLSTSGQLLDVWYDAGPDAGAFSGPTDVEIDGEGSILVADRLNDRIVKLDRWGNFLAQWGTFGTGDGQFNRPFATAVDAAGNVYVSDELNHRIQKFGTAVIEVALVVKPGDGPATINPRSKGVFPVAILTTRMDQGDERDFDAGEVDPWSLRCGPGGASIVHAAGHFEDVDGDGDLDLVCHFQTEAAGIACGDTTLEIEGLDDSGRRVHGQAPIRTVGCR